jgi:uncharacterized cofD-like protein
VTLKAIFDDGTCSTGETRITETRKPIRRLELEPVEVEPLTGALRAILRADVITLGPGSLYTSLIPNLLVREIVQTIQESRATKIYIQNIMTQPGETENYAVGDHILALMDHCDGNLLFPNVILNSGLPSPDILKRYEAEGASPVPFNRERLVGMGLKVVERDLLAEDRVIRHDPDRLARAVFEMAGFVRSHHA